MREGGTSSLPLFSARAGLSRLFFQASRAWGRVLVWSLMCSVMTAKGYSATAPQINWMTWSKAAFEQAAQEKKPILMDISATWCHWCMVMDEKSYADPEIIRLINENYIPVRVDADRRPDIVNRYSAGGFPTTAFLLPNGDVIASATYIPPAPLREALLRYQDYVSANYHGQKSALRPLEPTKSEVAISTMIISHLDQIISTEFDAEHGGFKNAPKFPTPDVNEYLLHRYLATKEKKYLEIVTANLEGMYHKGLFDPVGKGFFRYSTAADWSNPHYEKLLKDNAQLLSNYLLAYQVTGEELYRKVAEELIGYLLSTLYDQELGLFYQSQAADEDYYRLSEAERVSHEAPPVDKTFFTNYNVKAVRAFYLAGLVLENAEYLQVAERGLTFLRTRMRDPERGMAHYFEQTPQVYGLFDDNLSMMEALLEAYEVSGTATYLLEFEELRQFAERSFYNPKSSRYLDTAQKDGIGYLAINFPFLQENARMARALIKYTHYQTAKSQKNQQVADILGSFVEDYQKYGIQAASYGDALNWFWNYPVRAVIVGPRQDQTTLELARQFQGSRPNLRITIILDPAEDQERIKEERYAVTQEPTIYICFDSACLPPFQQPEMIRPALKNFPESPQP